MAMFRRSRLIQKAMRLLHSFIPHWDRAVTAMEMTMTATIRTRAAKSTRPAPSITSMASPVRMGTSSCVPTLAAANARLRAKKIQ